MKTLKLYVKGMTCTSCEVLLERSVSKVSGVNKVSVDRAREEMTVDCADDVTPEKLQQAVDPKYTLSSGTHPEEKPFFITKDKERLLGNGGGVMGIFWGYNIFLKNNPLPKRVWVD